MGEGGGGKDPTSFDWGPVNELAEKETLHTAMTYFMQIIKNTLAIDRPPPSPSPHPPVLNCAETGGLWNHYGEHGAYMLHYGVFLKLHPNTMLVCKLHKFVLSIID